MSVHVIDLGRTFPRDISDEKIVARTCKNCGAPLVRGTNKCEYCGTEYIADIVVRNELSEIKEKLMRLEMEKRTKELEIAMQEQTARLLEFYEDLQRGCRR